MIATRFAVGLHILILVADQPPGQATSIRLAEGIGTNPVVVRRIAGLLSRAGLITVQRGPGGASLGRPAEAITLRDVWRAIHPATERILRVHRGTDPAIPRLLQRRFEVAEAALLASLERMTLAELRAEAGRERPIAAAD